MDTIEKLKQKFIKFTTEIVGNSEAERLLSFMLEDIDNIKLLRETLIKYYVPLYIY